MTSIQTNHLVKYDSIKRNRHDSAVHYERIKKELFAVDINLADSASLCMLPGIGSKLASRIIHFRDKLGGFYDIEQVAETYGLPDSTYDRIKPFLNLGTKALVTININEADLSRLRQHPYIGWTIAKALVQYREQHGPFSSVEDISKISAISTDQVKRLIPYLSIY
jgi:competence ComEA-like helix-hairpin-helix protein